MPLSVNPSTPRLSSETQGHLIGTAARNHGQSRTESEPQVTRRSRRTICKVSLVPVLLGISSLLPDFLPQGLRGCTSPGTHFALKVTHPQTLRPFRAPIFDFFVCQILSYPFLQIWNLHLRP